MSKKSVSDSGSKFTFHFLARFCETLFIIEFIVFKLVCFAGFGLALWWLIKHKLNS